MLDDTDIQGNDITTDALLTQRKFTSFVVERKAHYHFTVKGSQATLKNDIALLFENRKKPDFVEITPPNHGRIEIRRIWCNTALNDYLDFPHVGQVCQIERETIYTKNGKATLEVVLGITSRTPEQASPQRTLKANCGHWTIENRCRYAINWYFDENLSRICTGHGRP